MSIAAWLAVVAAWTLIEISVLAYHLDALTRRVKRLETRHRLEAKRDVARACRSSQPDCPYLYRCLNECEWKRR